MLKVAKEKSRQRRLPFHSENQVPGGRGAATKGWILGIPALVVTRSHQSCVPLRPARFLPDFACRNFCFTQLSGAGLGTPPRSLGASLRKKSPSPSRFEPRKPYKRTRTRAQVGLCTLASRPRSTAQSRKSEGVGGGFVVVLVPRRDQ